MNLRGFTRAGLNRKMLATTLAGAILCALGQGIATQASSAADEWDEVLATARAVLAKMPEAARIEAAIKDPGLREAVRRAHRALKSCVKVNKNQSRAIKQGALADFERAFKAVQMEAERSEFQICAANCKIDGARCEQACVDTKKKLCACRLTEFGCFASKCLFP